jgi:branched-chain amino acid transport system ATP-binding protein
MAEPVLEIAGLCKRFGALVVTDDVSLRVSAHRIHAVIGPNGAGKTTLIQQIFGALPPDGGAVRLAGRDITRLAPHRRARVFQINSVFPEFSAQENVALAVLARGGSVFSIRRAAGDASVEAMAILGRLGLEGRHAVLAGLLSHGEKRKLELAMALASRPLVMLLDEPLAGAAGVVAGGAAGAMRHSAGGTRHGRGVPVG